jgi:CrcB protein
MNEVDQTRSRQEIGSAPKERSGWRQARETMFLYVAVSVGAVMGSVLRALASLAAMHWLGPEFPWGTLFVNIVGSFAIGFYATMAGPDGRIFAGTGQRQFVMTGVCGGFTTFSAFSLEAFLSLHAGKFAEAGLYVGVSVVTWLAATWFGHMLASRLNRLGGS